MEEKVMGDNGADLDVSEVDDGIAMALLTTVQELAEVTDRLGHLAETIANRRRIKLAA